MDGFGAIQTVVDRRSESAPTFAPFVGTRRLLVLLGLGLLLAARIVYLRFCPLDLIADEAYYWDWSRQLDWSYYSKPPLIAWLIALTTTLGGDSEFAIRIPAAIFGTVGLWGVYELGCRMYGHAAGVRALLIVAAAPGMTALCLLMTIDAPFLLAWTLAVYCLWRMLESDVVNARWLPPAILMTGVGLLTKQTALGLFLLVGLFLISGKSDRAKLRHPLLWTWLVGSAAFLLPVLWWNHRHAWITVEHTLAHFDLRSPSVLQRLTWFPEFVGSQFGLLSPVLYGMMLTVAAVLTSRFPNLPRRERFLICFGGLPLAAILVLSLFQRVQPNWPAALYLTCAILLAAWSCGEISLSPHLNRFRSWLAPAVALGCVMSLALSAVPFALPMSPLAGSKLDLTGRMRGWREAADQVSAKLASSSGSKPTLIIAATARGPVSELAYYLPGRPHVYRWNVGEVIDSQHDVWGGPKDGTGRDGLIVTEGESPVPERLANAFDTLEDLGAVIVPLGAGNSRQFRVWRGGHLRAWPERQSKAVAVATRPIPPSQ